MIDDLLDRPPAAVLLDKARSNGEKTEARTWVGFKATIAGRHQEALQHLQWARDRGARKLRRIQYGSR